MPQLKRALIEKDFNEAYLNNTSKKEFVVKQNEFDEKIHELEEALIERRAELGRSKTSEAEEEKLLVLQTRTEALCDDARRPCGQHRKLEIIRLANELLLELRQNPLA